MSRALSLRARLSARLPVGEVLRFGVVGICATLVHFATLTLAVEAAGVPAALANGLAFCTAVGVTYLGQSYWVFRAPDHSLVRMQKFLLTAVGGLLANVAVMGLVVNGLGLHYRVGFVTALVLVPAATFVVNKLWVFRAEAPR